MQRRTIQFLVKETVTCWKYVAEFRKSVDQYGTFVAAMEDLREEIAVTLKALGDLSFATEIT